MRYYGLMRNTDHIYTPKKRYYAARQLFRFVRPGSVRIKATTEDSNLMVSAFRNDSSGSLILVGVKRGASASQVQIALTGGSQIPLAWDLYQTTRSLDCASMGTLKTENNMVQLELPDEAIFTLVGTTRKP